MGNLAPPPAVYNQSAGELQMPSSDTTQDASTSSSSGFSRKKLDPAALEAQQAVEQANASVNEASAPAVGNQTVQDFNAGIVSQQAAMHPEDDVLQGASRQAVNALPDPFQPGNPTPATDPRQALVTQQQAQDRVAQFKADEEARAAQASQREQERIEASRQKKVDAAMQRLDQTASEYEQKSFAASHKEDRGIFHNILSAFAVGLGSYGASITHSPNYALEILNKEMDQDAERKKLAMESAFNRYKQAGLAPGIIADWAKTQHENLLAKQKAQLDTVERLGAKALAPFPSAQQSFLQGVATKKQEQAKDRRDFLEKSTGITVEQHAGEEGAKHTSVRATPKGEEGKSAGQAVIAKSALDAAKQNQAYLDSLDEDTYKKITQQSERGTAAAEHNKEALRGGLLERTGAKLNQGAYDVTGGLVGTPESGYQAVRDVAGEDGEAFVSRDKKVTSAVVGMTNAKAAANPNALEELAKDKGATSPGLSLAEAKRRNEEHVKILEAETDRQAKPLAKIEANAAKRTGGAQPSSVAVPTPKSRAEQQKALMALSKADQVSATTAMTMKKSDPGYARAQKWLASKGIR